MRNSKFGRKRSEEKNECELRNKSSHWQLDLTSQLRMILRKNVHSSGNNYQVLLGLHIKKCRKYEQIELIEIKIIKVIRIFAMKARPFVVLQSGIQLVMELDLLIGIIKKVMDLSCIQKLNT